MKSKTILTDARGKSHDEHNALVVELREKLRLARIDLQRGKTKNPQEARRLKKDIARVLTVSNQTASTN